MALAFPVMKQPLYRPFLQRQSHQRPLQHYLHFGPDPKHHLVTLFSTTTSPSTTTTTSGGIIQELHVPLSNGIIMQVICGIPHNILQSSSSSKQISETSIILLLHGSFHGAWCYQEHYIPYLIEQQQQQQQKQQSGSSKYIVIAPSWRGTSGTPPLDNQQKSPKKVKIQEHVDDLYNLMQDIPTLLQHMISDIQNNNTTTVLPLSTFASAPLRLYVVCHSFGGIVVMKYLEKYYSNTITANQQHLTLNGIITLSSIPPTGNGEMTLRFLRRSIRQSYQITVGFALKQCCTNIALCRTLFFDDTMDDLTIQRYQSHFQQDSKITIDLLDLAKQLPSQNIDSETGTANFITNSSHFPPCCVMGALNDYIVDTEAVLETARYFRCYNNDTGIPVVPQVTWIDSTHDVMLGPKWKNGANAIMQWIQQQDIGK